MAGPRNYRSASGKSIGETLSTYGERSFAAIEKQVYREETEIMTASFPLVPVDTGALRGSGYAAEPVRDENHILGEFGYGGVATKINPKTLEPTSTYALAVHENLDAHHEVGQAKYLEAPTDAAMQGMTGRIVAGVRSAMAGSGSGSQAPGEETPS